MPTIADVRSKFPQYNDMSDDQLASALHQKYYADLPEDVFRAKIGMNPQGPSGGQSAPPAPSGQPPQQAAVAPQGDQPPAEDGFWHNVQGVAAKAAQGATLGFSDEALAGLKTGFGFAGDYGKQLQHERDILDTYGEQHPIVSALSEIVGGLALPGGLAKGGVSLVGRVAAKQVAERLAAQAAGRTIGVGTRLANTAKNIGAGAVEGAGYGAINGAGSSDGDLGDRAAGAAGGALAGGAFGGALPAVTGAVGAVGKPILNGLKDNVLPEALGGRSAADAAARRIAPTINPDKVAGTIGRAATAGQNLGVADAGTAATDDLLKTASAKSGNRGAIATRAAASQQSAVGRIKNLVSDAFSAPEGAYQNAKTSIMDARSQAAQPYYQHFYAQPVEPSDELNAVLATPAGRSALAAAKQNAANRRQPALFDFANDEGDVVKTPNAQALDETKRVLDNAVEAAKVPSDGSPFAKKLETPQSRAIQSVRDDLVNHMDTIGDGSYAKARDVAGENIRADEAIEFGRKALNVDPRVTAARMGQPGAAATRDRAFTPDEQNLARVGAADAIHQKLEGAGFTEDAINRFFRTPQQRAQIRALFPTDAEFRTFQRSLVAEARKGNTDTIAARAAGNPRLGSTNDLAGDVNAAGVGRQAVMWGPKAALFSVASKALQLVGGMSPKVADEVGKQLMIRDPQQVAQVLSRIRAVGNGDIAKAQKSAMVRRIVTDAVGEGAGRALATSSDPPSPLFVHVTKGKQPAYQGIE